MNCVQMGPGAGIGGGVGLIEKRGWWLVAGGVIYARLLGAASQSVTWPENARLLIRYAHNPLKSLAVECRRRYIMSSGLN